MIKTAMVTSLFNMHFPPAALIGCLWNSSKENVQKKWKVAMVKFALHEYFS